MTDDWMGERWLRENDPAHKASDYRGPQIEYAAGCASDLATVVAEKKGAYVEHGAHALLPERSCRICNKAFAPREAKNDLCGDPCKRQARNLYQRDLMRQRRQAA